MSQTARHHATFPRRAIAPLSAAGAGFDNMRHA